MFDQVNRVKAREDAREKVKDNIKPIILLSIIYGGRKGDEVEE